MSNGSANRYPDRFVARVLSDALDYNDLIAAKRHNVSDRTIRGWRTRMETDPVLMAEYLKLRNIKESGWQVERIQALKVALEKVRDLIAQITDPAQLKDVIKAVQTLGELTISAEALNVDLQNSIESPDASAGAEREAEGAEGSDNDIGDLN